MAQPQNAIIAATTDLITVFRDILSPPPVSAHRTARALTAGTLYRILTFAGANLRFVSHDDN
jgi:hypothetical protein